MNALTLRGIVAEELGSLQLRVTGKCGGLGELRKTCWTRELPGFGTRHYGSGRKIYIVQARMEGHIRTVTIGNAKVLSRAQAMDVARRVLLRAQTGENPAEERKRLRKVPSYRDFLKTYWDRVSPKWKPSTLYTHRYYKRKYLDRAFEGLFLDEIEERHVQEWFNRITNTGGPGAANRCAEILRAMFNKAEEWGVRPEGSNPCLYIRKNIGPEVRALLVRSGVQTDRRSARPPPQGLSAPLRCDQPADPDWLSQIGDNLSPMERGAGKALAADRQQNRATHGLAGRNCRDYPARPAAPGKAALCVLEPGNPASNHGYRQLVEQVAR